MNSSTITGMVVSGAVCLFMFVLSLFLLQGKGAFLIAGYNTMSKEEQQKYDVKALCRFVGRLLMAIMLCTIITLTGAYLSVLWLIFVGMIAVVAIITVAVIYANTGRRFQK